MVVGDTIGVEALAGGSLGLPFQQQSSSSRLSFDWMCFMDFDLGRELLIKAAPIGGMLWLGVASCKGAGGPLCGASKGRQSGTVRGTC